MTSLLPFPGKIAQRNTVSNIGNKKQNAMSGVNLFVNMCQLIIHTVIIFFHSAHLFFGLPSPHLARVVEDSPSFWKHTTNGTKYLCYLSLFLYAWMSPVISLSCFIRVGKRVMSVDSDRESLSHSLSLFLSLSLYPSLFIYLSIAFSLSLYICMFQYIH